MEVKQEINNSFRFEDDIPGSEDNPQSPSTGGSGESNNGKISTSKKANMIKPKFAIFDIFIKNYKTLGKSDKQSLCFVCLNVLRFKGVNMRKEGKWNRSRHKN